ncbi:capsule assembly Wzi family protein [Psychrobium sp. 1_MG-2023]|uniref:capsule assembly Wzi family protein n=1 Tax=Psychrobium sp. 1_MG-2023 TaxID=3062624 RepID=UPI000C348844|nr:capsule assembly Wzi family protein [Psychrobium sp. 1_MG-2023]MDP2562536.1 capsule assembly Wzi family protein [Psychrobium sp. 1_MG-2023]PKF57972.1 hypothetical protein CW748_05495 [Alteromonadales bacterium alter-6D02]
MFKRCRALLFPLTFLMMAPVAHAGVSPYLPLKLNATFELEVERLVSLTGYPALKKPYHIATMVQYLDQVKESHPQLHARINRYIKRYKKPHGITHLETELRVSSSTEKTLPNSRGRSTDSSYYAEFSGFWQPSKYFIANIGGGYDKNEKFLPFGNYLSFGVEEFQVDVGYREHWLSPLQDSSMLLSTQALPMLGVTFSNVTPLTDWDIMYELGFGELAEVDGIMFDGEATTGKPGFLTMHLSSKFTDWWTFSASRTMQFGGGGRGKVGLSDIWDAIIDPVNSDNCGGNTDLQDCNEELGNQQAALASRFDLSWQNNPYSIIVEIAGEDTNDYKAYKLGNKTYTLGLFLPYLSERESLNITAQYAEDRWYTHHLYNQGYSNEGHKMGHWWGDEKISDDTIGAKILGFKYTRDLDIGGRLSAEYNTIENVNSEDVSPNTYERGHYLQLDYHWQYSGQFLGLHLYAGKDVNGESFSSLAVSRQW